MPTGLGSRPAFSCSYPRSSRYISFARQWRIVMKTSEQCYGGRICAEIANRNDFFMKAYCARCRTPREIHYPTSVEARARQLLEPQRYAAEPLKKRDGLNSRFDFGSSGGLDALRQQIYFSSRSSAALFTASRQTVQIKPRSGTASNSSLGFGKWQSAHLAPSLKIVSC